MENVKIKKINLLYLLGYIFIPMIITAICFIISANFFPTGNMAVILIMGPSFLSVIWWIFGGRFIYKQKKKKLEKKFEEMGYTRNQTFYGDGAEVIVDTNAGKIGLQFFWNPFDSYIIPANRIEKAWVNDGKSGSGLLEGSSCVSFLFNVDTVKIRVYTFKSNQRWKMNSDYILTGISKADMMVNILETAKKNSK